MILALSLGIGAHTAIFSVVNAVSLRPLPYEQADRLVFLNDNWARDEACSYRSRSRGLGLAGAFAPTRLMTTMLFGLEPTDAATFLAISLLLPVVALLACYLPGRRATKVEPIDSLRYE